MSKVDGVSLLESIYPHFFERENIKNLYVKDRNYE